MRKLGDLIWNTSENESNIAKRFVDMARQLALVQQRPVSVAQLQEIAADLGEISAGRFIAGDLTIIDSTTEGNAPTVSGSGVVIDGDGIPVSNGGDYANIIGYNSGTVTFYQSATDGKMYAGGGAVTLDNSGISISTGLGTYNLLKWISGGNTVMSLGTLYVANSLNSASFDIVNPGGSGSASLLVNVGNVTFGMSDDTSNYVASLTSQSDQISPIHYGDYAGFYSVDSSTSEETMYTRTVKAGSLGAYGSLLLDFDGICKNTDGGSRNITIRAYVGGTGGTKVFDSGVKSISNTNYYPYSIRVELCNNASASAQTTTVTQYGFVNNGIATSSTPTTWNQPTVSVVDSTINTASSDMDIVITTQLSASSANLITQRKHARFYGPYYASS